VEYLRDQTAQRHIISYHDECSCHASDCEKRRWSIKGKGGKMGDKSRGPCRMVAAYVSDAVGLWTESMKIIEPGIADNKDDYWGREDTQAQAAEHLLEFDRRFNPVAGQPVVVCLDVYDNSSGHNCRAIDGLEVSKMNLNPGGAAKVVLVMRNGSYLCAERGVNIEQPMFFQLGDTVHVAVQKDSNIRPRSTQEAAKTTRDYPVGSVIDGESELLQVQKSVKQVLLERKVLSRRELACRRGT
jgi:hypothetical protein